LIDLRSEPFRGLRRLTGKGKELPMKMLTLLLGLSLFTHAYAGEKGDRFAKRLGLSEDQMTKVTEVRKSNSEKLKEDRKKFKELKKAFDNAMKDPKTTSAELKNKFEAFQKARDVFHRERFEKMLKMREILTPEQLAKFQEIKKERGPKSKDWKKMKRKD